MKRVKLWAWLALAVILLAGASARFYKLSEKSLWSDEIATIATSMGNSIDPEAYVLRGESFDPPESVLAALYRDKATRSHGAGNWGQTAQVLKLNVHPPLFFMLMNLWIHQFGLEAGTLRIPAVLFGLLSVAMMFGLALRLADWAPETFQGNRRESFALLASAMMALSAYQVDHAQDARQYTLLIALAIGAVWLAVILLQRQGRGFWPWLALALLLAAGLYTQYFFGLFASFIFLLLLVVGWRQRPVWMGVLACGLLVGLLFLPWLSVFREQLVFLKLAGHYTAGLWTPLQLPEKLWRIFCEFLLPHSALGKVLPLVVLLGWGGSVWLTGGFQKERFNAGPFRRWSPVLLFVLAWLVFLVVGQIALDLFKNAHTATIRRYLLLVSPAWYLLMAYILCATFRQLEGLRWRWFPVTATVILLGLMAVDTGYMLGYRHTSSDEFKQAAQRINATDAAQTGTSRDLVLVSKTGAMAVGLAYYLKPTQQMLGIDVPSAAALGPESPIMKQLTTQVQKLPREAGVWLVFSHTASSTRHRLAQWMTGLGYQSSVEFKVPGVRLTRWTRRR